MSRENVPSEQLLAWEERRRDFGRRLRAVRLRKGLTQEALALESGVSRNQVIYLENGARGLLLERLGDLTAALNCSAVDLLPADLGGLPDEEFSQRWGTPAA